VNEAALQAKNGKLDEALGLYQQALRLDDSTADTSASAEDWNAYGRFLDDAGFPPRLAFACLVKSESLVKSLPNPTVPASVAAERQKIETRLGATAAAIRRDPEPTLQEALALRR
jgi:tetratricopeptide (TPR) repeat protein